MKKKKKREIPRFLNRHIVDWELHIDKVTNSKIFIGIPKFHFIFHVQAARDLILASDMKFHLIQLKVQELHRCKFWAVNVKLIFNIFPHIYCNYYFKLIILFC